MGLSILGMYPQTVVPSGDTLHTTLTNGVDVAGSGVTATGTYYTANKDKTAWNPDDNDPNYSQELNPVYEYENKRYVRVTPYAYADNDAHRYNYSTEENPDYIGREGYRWFRVEPIKWIVLNYNISILGNTDGVMVDSPTLLESETYELYAVDVLISGISFGVATHTSWEGSTVSQYLNGKFHDEAFTTDETNMIQVSTIYNNNGGGNITSASHGLNSNYPTITGGVGYNETNQKIYLLSRYELDNTNSPYIQNNVFGTNKIVDVSKRQISGSDYAKAHNLAINENGFTSYWIRTAYTNGASIYRVNATGSATSYIGVYNAYLGTRPALTMFCFCFVGRFVTVGVSILGMYPQTVVPSGADLHTALTNGMDVAGSGVIATGEHYTANVNGSAWSSGNQELNPVYEHDNKRYVRVTPFAQDITPQYQYNNNGGKIGQVASTNGSASTWRWFKVEPIKWIILNFNQLIVKDDNDIVTDLPRLNTDIQLELYAADALVGGIRFGSNSLWSASDINTYLNSKFLDEAFSSSEIDLIQDSIIYNNNGDGTEFNSAAHGLNSNHLTSGSGMNPTEQRVYMLSHYELTNPESPYTLNGVFESGNESDPIYTTRRLKGTDYARAHCFYINSNDYATYWTRSTYDSKNVFLISFVGRSTSYDNTHAYLGTRPALTMVCFSSLTHQVTSS